VATKPKEPSVTMEEKMLRLIPFAVTSLCCVGCAVGNADWTALFFAILTCITLLPLLPAEWDIV